MAQFYVLIDHFVSSTFKTFPKTQTYIMQSIYLKNVGYGITRDVSTCFLTWQKCLKQMINQNIELHYFYGCYFLLDKNVLREKNSTLILGKSMSKNQ